MLSLRFFAGIPVRSTLLNLSENSGRWLVWMVETRIAPRLRVVKPAIIEYGGDKTPCTVRDISTTGAAIEVSHAAKIPPRFILILPEDRLRLLCQVVWRRDFRVGVAFE
jgi:hypothetical protein